jgi:hypothetical protein
MSFGRVRERDLIIPALRAAAAEANGEIQMTKLIEQLAEEFEPQGEDAEIIQGRQDSKFSQKVRNLVSHRDSSTSMFTKGYALHLPESESIRITDAGRSFLDQVPDE